MANTTGKKFGGRSKGTPNKETTTIRHYISAITEGGRDKFEEELNKLEGKEYVNSFIQLLDYSLPKLQRIEYTDDSDTKVKLDFTKYTKEELAALRELIAKSTRD